MENEHNWLGLAAGNSRLHWGWFRDQILLTTWDTPHLGVAVRSHQLPHLYLHRDLVRQRLTDISVYLASVVAQQTKYWQDYHQLKLISLQDIQLSNIYPTMGIDRALAVWGAFNHYQRSCLIIDGGTALTFTGVDQQKQLLGGAILPGLRSQLLTLKQKTAALPEIQLPPNLPLIWALDTESAIASGILHTAISGIYDYILDWLKQFPDSQIIFTGGDGELLAKFLQQKFPNFAGDLVVEKNLVFKGIKLVSQDKNTNHSNHQDTTSYL